MIYVIKCSEVLWLLLYWSPQGVQALAGMNASDLSNIK